MYVIKNIFKILFVFIKYHLSQSQVMLAILFIVIDCESVNFAIFFCNALFTNT
jgi:hypothetical protein